MATIKKTLEFDELVKMVQHALYNPAKDAPSNGTGNYGGMDDIQYELNRCGAEANVLEISDALNKLIRCGTVNLVMGEKGVYFRPAK